MQNQFVVEYDLRTFWEEVVVVCDSAAIENISSLAVEALRRVVSGMQSNANPYG
jgi:hypothetical protein